MSDLSESLRVPEPDTLALAGLDLVSLLEQRVASLVERYRGAQKNADERATELELLDERLRALEARVEADERLRGELRVRVAGLIDRVKRMEAAGEGDQQLSPARGARFGRGAPKR